jgi:hypothetical protein
MFYSYIKHGSSYKQAEVKTNQTNTNNVNKTWILLQTGGGKDIYVICVCLIRLYLRLFVGGSMFYLRYLCLFDSSLPPVVCRRIHFLFTLYVFTNNVNKTWILLQIGGGKDEPNKHK